MKEIEELKLCGQKEGKLDLTEDDGLEYLVKLADELWPIFSDDEYEDALLDAQYNNEQKGVYEKIDRSKFYSDFSIVPSIFQIVYFQNKIDKSNLEKYQKGLLLNALDQWGIDARKFWYLCLGVKWLTEAYKKQGRNYETIERN